MKLLFIILFLTSCSIKEHGYREPVKWEFKPKELKYILKQVRVGDTLVECNNGCPSKRWVIQEIKRKK